MDLTEAIICFVEGPQPSGLGNAQPLQYTK